MRNLLLMIQTKNDEKILNQKNWSQKVIYSCLNWSDKLKLKTYDDEDDEENMKN